jgi:hypothetical protein
MERYGETSKSGPLSLPEAILMNALGREGIQAGDLEQELPELRVLCGGMESILDLSERVLLQDPEGSGIPWVNVMGAIGSLAEKIIDRMGRIYEGITGSRARRPEAPAILETTLIQERLRAGRTFALLEKRTSYFAEGRIKTFGDTQIATFGRNVTRLKTAREAYLNAFSAANDAQKTERRTA